MTDINRIRQPKLRCRIQENITNPLDNRSLFTLPNVHDFQKSAVAFAEVQNVTEYFLDEIFQSIRSYYGRIGHAEWFNEALGPYINHQAGRKKERKNRLI